MKNEIYFYYKLEPMKIQQQQDKIIFYVNNKKYILRKVESNISVLKEKYNIHNYLNIRRIYCHKIILNTAGNMITIIQNNQYVLIEINIETRKIRLDDIIYLMNIKINTDNFKKIKRGWWKDLWKRKVDYIENQKHFLKQNQEIATDNIDFFIGITENCISLINQINKNTLLYSISHDRINPKETTDDFYNPLNFIIDIRIRDIAEYIKKTEILDKKLEILNKVIVSGNVNENEFLMLFIRLLFPSEFYDQNDIIMSNMGSTKQKSIIADTYIEEIKKIYHYFKGIINLPSIEWFEDIY